MFEATTVTVLTTEQRPMLETTTVTVLTTEQRPMLETTTVTVRTTEQLPMVKATIVAVLTMEQKFQFMAFSERPVRVSITGTTRTCGHRPENRQPKREKWVARLLGLAVWLLPLLLGAGAFLACRSCSWPGRVSGCPVVLVCPFLAGFSWALLFLLCWGANPKTGLSFGRMSVSLPVYSGYALPRYADARVSIRVLLRPRFSERRTMYCSCGPSWFGLCSEPQS